ncbi:hypothetical protein HG440_002395 [Candidatus Saccharibacteria bacterium]|nr:hypothetical protein [Candidatus Saccharibacteria bacterium]
MSTVIDYTAVTNELAQMREDVMSQRDIYHYEWIDFCGKKFLTLVLQGPSYGLCKKVQSWLEYYGMPADIAELVVDEAAKKIDDEVREENRKELLTCIEAEFGLWTDPRDVYTEPGTSLRADSIEYYSQEWDTMVA